jgi:hypothetical protein
MNTVAPFLAMTMRLNLIRTAILLTAIPLTICSQSPAWVNIRPVESTIADVERIFGKARKRDRFIRYEVDDGVYYFSFSEGVCVTKWKEEWNSKLGGLPPLKEGTPLSDWDLPEWSVEKVSYSPNEWISVASLGIDLAKLKKVNKSPDTPDIFDYVDEEEGISYAVQYEYKRNGGRVRKIPMVTGITLFPAARYSNLVCKIKGDSSS